MGGGIGAAYAGMGTLGFDQTILLLEEPINRPSLKRVEAEEFRILVRPDRELAVGALKDADVIVVSWVHHPAVTKFLCEFPEVPVRTALWSHVSGNYFPAIRPGFLRLFDQCAFATHFTQTLPDVAAMGERYAAERFHVVYGLGDLRRFSGVGKKPHDRFVIGYVGTLNFCKLHPRFLDYCEAAAQEDVVFTLIGDPSPSDELELEAEKRGLSPYIRFVGYSDDIPGALSEMDAFGYLLNPQHYGATENALLEAMTAGVPAVALDQCVERIIIKNGQTGLLVDTPGSYAQAIRYLRQNDVSDMTRKAREDTLSRYDLQANRERMRSCLEAAAAYDKKIPDFREFFGKTPADWFLCAVEADKDCFLLDRADKAGRIFHESTKGSPRHYSAYFPNDQRLSAWARELDGNKRRNPAGEGV